MTTSYHELSNLSRQLKGFAAVDGPEVLVPLSLAMDLRKQLSLLGDYEIRMTAAEIAAMLTGATRFLPDTLKKLATAFDRVALVQGDRK